MSTLSQLVDDMVSETKRPDLRVEIARYVNQTMRELHQEPEGKNAVLYQENYHETQIVATLETGQTWDVPDPAVFQGVSVVRFDNASKERFHSSFDIDTYAVYQQPGPGFSREKYAYYRGGSRYVFGGMYGYGGVNAVISIGFYEFVRSLKYYTPEERPAVYDLESGWTYHPDYDTDEETRSAARDKVTNWILFRWYDVISEGIRAKVYKRLSDTERARTSYSLYESLRKGLYTTEVSTGVGVT